MKMNMIERQLIDARSFVSGLLRIKTKLTNADRRLFDRKFSHITMANSLAWRLAKHRSTEIYKPDGPALHANTPVNINISMKRRVQYTIQPDIAICQTPNRMLTQSTKRNNISMDTCTLDDPDNHQENLDVPHQLNSASSINPPTC